MVYYGVLINNEYTHNNYNYDGFTNSRIRINEVKEMSEEEFRESFDVKTVVIITTFMILSFIVGNYFQLFRVFGF